MTNAALVTRVAQEAALTKRQAATVCRICMEPRQATLSRGERLTLVGVACLPDGCVPLAPGISHAPAKRWSWRLARAQQAGPVNGGERQSGMVDHPRPQQPPRR